MHQQDVVHAFLDRVCDIGDDVHECTLCLECHHGMTLHNTLCARCHNEVGSPFSLVCTLTDILMPTVHKTANSATNYADSGEITAELHEIIDDITQMEEIFRSLALLPLPWTPDALPYADDTDSSLVNTSLRHQVSEHPKHRDNWASW